MNYNIETLSPADFFPLLTLLRRSMASAAGHYIDPLKVYPRFLKPTKDLMENHIAARYDGKLIAAASVFPAEFEINNEKLKVSEILISADSATDKALLENLLKLAEEKAKNSDCNLVYSDSILASDHISFADKTIYKIGRSTVCNNEDLQKVFAFMNPRVLTKYDKDGLKSIYAALPHEILEDKEFFAALSARDREPIVIKDSHGGVVGLLLCDSYSNISDCYFKSTNDIKAILKAYFIFYQLDSLCISPSPFDKGLNIAFSELSYETDYQKNPFSYKIIKDEKFSLLSKGNGIYLPPII